MLAHHADAPFIRAQTDGPPPDLAEWEQPIYDQVMSRLPPQPPAPPRIDRELGDGDEPGFGDGAVTVAVPGHTPGSIALYLPRHHVLFTGDAAARGQDGTVMCGVFNVNRAQAAASFRRLAGLRVGVSCFGHGEPLTQDAAAALEAAAATADEPGTGRVNRNAAAEREPRPRCAPDPSSPSATSPGPIGPRHAGD